MANLTIRNLPDDLYRRLMQRAAREHRSVAQEATHILEDALAEPETLSLLELDGLGRDAWAAVDAARHVEDERAAWD